MSIITLSRLKEHGLEQFVLDNQEAFKYGAMEEFGVRDEHFEEGDEIIARKTILDCIEQGTAYRIREDGMIVGGMVLKIGENTNHNELELLFIKPAYDSRNGYRAWKELETMYPETEVWGTCTPYFEKRNIHFYVNKCGFHIVEFYGRFHKDPHVSYDHEEMDDDEMFRFEKRMK